MLHILLTLLKIIGILILSIIGICILLVLLVIFTPLRYELSGDFKGDLDSLNINARFSFFMRLINVRIQFHEKKLEWQARLAWKHLGSEKSSGDEQNDSLENATVSKVSPIKEELPVTKTDEKVLLNETVEKTVVDDSKRNDNTTKKTAPKIAAKKEDKKEDNEENKKEKSSLNDKINSFVEKIKCTSSKICDMIDLVKEKTKVVTEFINNEQHRAALKKLFIEVKKLFKKLIPKKLKGTITFGFDDPGTTGKVLAGISLLYPYIKDNLNIYTDFEGKKLVGDLYIKGRIRISMFLAFLLNLVLNKNVRITISHILKIVKSLKQGGK